MELEQYVLYSDYFFFFFNEMESVCVLGCSEKLADAYLVWESSGQHTGLKHMHICSIYSVISHLAQYFFEIKVSEALE